MKHSKGTKVAAIAATVLAAGLVAAGPAQAAAPAHAAGVRPACVSSEALHASILKAAAAESPDAVISTRTSGLVSNDPV
ncbi:hypothetical protein POF50_019915 [Streptomyces sp. SL13]|jgi:hypothetical protein|uniref:Uncharacterized protein n=1 Tax=Streptantibioticus silvisoli TaxID=2705255 RepID=A0AA90H6P9_9ACTN|nr:hypothetical protein [Streptantibioticus silvisoli]MDI5965634.1 hypothetical protein [Streptantibioticus silvisoli]MDI5971569.1 hypothetical protein [Streptantibioticus silvisoli]